MNNEQFDIRYEVVDTRAAAFNAALQRAMELAYAENEMLLNTPETRASLQNRIIGLLKGMEMRGDIRPGEYGIKLDDLRVRESVTDPQQVNIEQDDGKEAEKAVLRARGPWWPKKPPGQIDDWEVTMTPGEVSWCWDRINAELTADDYGGCVDSFRAARAWKSSQVRRFKRARSCCGSHEWVAYRWSWKKFRFDKYILGFNFGH